MTFLTLITYPIRLWRRISLKCKLGSFGSGSVIISPLHLDGPQNIYLGHHVSIQYKTWLSAIPFTSLGGANKCKLIFGDGCTIGHFNHIIATSRIEFGKNVLTADKVYVSDCTHGFEDINTPIKCQSVLQKNEIYIGDDSWIGENVCVIGASIGKHCVIGANSVVTRDIPEYSVAVGSPARVIKRYDFERQEWRKTDKEGKFIN